MSVEVEEEWPSLGLVLEEKEEVVESAGEEVDEEEKMSVEVEEECPKINMIPGLNSTLSESSHQKSRPRSQSVPEVNDSSSLGELRFKDE